MYQLARHLLFTIPPEASHDIALACLRGFGQLPGVVVPRAGKVQHLFGLSFANRVGLAAGLDKDARAVEGLARLGFGFVEVGTVTPKAQPGNARPRLFRLENDRALINRMGFNNAGVDAMAMELERVRRRGKLNGTLLGANLGKNKDTPLETAEDDYVACMMRLHDLVDYFTLNLSSPNTPGLRQLQTGEAMQRLIERVKDAQSKHAKYVPVLVKVAPDLVDEEVAVIAANLLRYDVDGLIATNTTVSRPQIATSIDESGGLSGRPLRPLSRSIVAKFRRELPDNFPIIGVGGVGCVSSAQQMIDAGASLIQIYTSFIYEGPKLVRKLAQL